VIEAVPAVTPVAIPVTGSIVAFALPLVHTPPAGVAVNVVVAFTQILSPPDIELGNGFTVTVTTDEHPPTV